MNNIRYLESQERKRRGLGAGAHCSIAGCDESRPSALSRSGSWLCYQHLLERESGELREYELNHIAGLGRGPRLPLHPNDHRVLTDKFNASLAPRFLSFERSPIEEMVATMVGHVLHADQLIARGLPSQFGAVLVPPEGGIVTVNIADHPRFVHVFGTDEAWWQPTWYTPLVRVR